MTATATAASPKKWAREYETIYILRPNVDPDDAEKIAARVREVMERLGGTLTKVDNWGTRKLAYTIRKYTRGIFIYVSYVAFNDLVAELERNLRLFEPVMRYQTILVREMVDPDSVEFDAEEVEFVRIEQGEDEPELDRAQRLGLAPIERPEKADTAEEESEGSDEEAQAKESSEEETQAQEKAEEKTEEKTDEKAEEKAEASDDSADASKE